MSKETIKDFEEFLEKLDVMLSPNDPLLKKMPQKEFLPLIEEKLRQEINSIVFENLMHLLINTKSELPDETVKALFDDALKQMPESNKLARISSLCHYIVAFKKNNFCGTLKKILDKYGTKEHLVDTTPSFLVEPLYAVGELNCEECWENIKKVESFGTKINPRVRASAIDAGKKIVAKEMEREM